MPNFIHRHLMYRRREKNKKNLMNALTDLIKTGLDSIIKGWGKRQLVKLGAVIIPVVGITQNDWDGTATLIIASALMLIEIIFSKINASRLKKGAILAD